VKKLNGVKLRKPAQSMFSQTIEYLEITEKISTAIYRRCRLLIGKITIHHEAHNDDKHH